MATKGTLFLYFAMFSLASCQGTKSAFKQRPGGGSGTVVLLHDSQSPEPTRVPAEAWELEDAAVPRKAKQR
jgi:hypothetical protein